ncbi:hypothetical protein [Sulfitobacter dubius]|uniref:hypothetical protein n=1 Tax=Sulfitobacter dubius TaxID=218673 RepID=UPI0022AF2DDE|nr:hypothetical protein [Sulfitobacter dubius]MCZ4365496.1 hypothetical protein [Sulfitobacter dubius]
MTDFKRSPEILAAIERSIEAENRLKDDLDRVACWIETRHPGGPVGLEIQRHYACEDDEIAHVVPLIRNQEVRRVIRNEAESAFRALGWIIKPEGRDVRSIFAHAQSQSQHARLRYYTEICNVMHNIEAAVEAQDQDQDQD